MLASQADAQAHPQERGHQHEVGEVRGDADLRAEPADQRQLEDQDREGREGQLDGGTAPAAGEGSFFYVAAFAAAENDDSRSILQICSLYSV
jgi:hypothetical protein